MSLLTLWSLLLFAALIARSLWVPLSHREMIVHAFLFALYCNITLILYLWLQVPKEIQVISYFLFGGGAFWFAAEILGYFLKKGGFSPENLNLFKKYRKGTYQEILLACQQLAEAKLGALMILERKQTLSPWCQKGILVDALISKELIHSIFTPPGAPHDGAVIFRKDRMAACAVIVPLSSNTRLPKDLGTRHRAAVGFSEITDGVCLVVSEETGSISIADRGALNYNIPFTQLPEALERALRFKRQKRKPGAPILQAVEIL